MGSATDWGFRKKQNGTNNQPFLGNCETGKMGSVLFLSWILPEIEMVYGLLAGPVAPFQVDQRLIHHLNQESDQLRTPGTKTVGIFSEI